MTRAAVFLAPLFLFVSACTIYVPVRERRAPRYEPAPHSPVSATAAEIDAACRLDIDFQKQEALTRIARRSNLDPEDQAQLARAALECLSIDLQKRDVLLQIINGPRFGEPAKIAILDGLDSLAISHMRNEILAAIDARGERDALPSE